MMHTVNVRKYKKDLTLDSVFEVENYKNTAIALAKGLLSIDKLMGPLPGNLPLNPCNISVRGKGGRFVKWRNK